MTVIIPYKKQLVFFVASLALATAYSGIFPTATYSSATTSSCTIDRLRYLYAKLSRHDIVAIQLTLFNTQLGKIVKLPSDPPPKASLLNSQKLPEDVKTSIFDALERLAAIQKQASELKVPKGFGEWLQNQKERLTLPVLKQCINSGYTLGQLQLDLRAEYIWETASRNPSFLEAHLVAPIANPHVRKIIRPIVGTISWGIKNIKPILVGAIIAGPFAGGVNNIVSGPITPVLNYLNQFGQNHLSAITRMVQKILANLATVPEHKNRLETLQAEMDRYNFKAMSQEEAYKKWKELDRNLRLMYLQNTKALPGDVQVGRSYEFNIGIGYMRGFLNDLSAHDTNLEVHNQSAKACRSELAGLDKKPQDQLSLAESDRIRELKKELSGHEAMKEQALNNIAMTMASIAIFDFLYFEFTQNHKLGDTIMNRSYQVMKENSHFDLYIKAVQTQTQEILEQMDYAINAKDFFESIQRASNKAERK
ncbi:MAG: hypothetical protein AABZ06_00315 [Bdellovibrionota bacterium]